MNAADRIALIDRLARAITWSTLSEDEQSARRRDAETLVRELEIGREQTDRLGWMLLPELEPGPLEDVES